MIDIIILLVVGAVGVMFYLITTNKNKKPKYRTSASQAANKKKGAPTQSESLEKLKRNNHFWGVEIKTPGCMEAIKLAEKQFPIDTAPALPLPNCSAKHCTCIYSGLMEHRGQARRIQEERRNEVRFDPKHPDRRSNKDRRKNVDTWRTRDY